MILRVLFLIFLISPVYISAEDSLNNILIYDDGSTQVNSEINPYQTLSAGVPIQGSVMVTHDSNKTVEIDSFRLGNAPLKVTLTTSTPMTDVDNLIVSVYNFQLKGMDPGTHLLPSIKVKVDGKEYFAPPLSIEIPR